MFESCISPSVVSESFTQPLSCHLEWTVAMVILGFVIGGFLVFIYDLLFGDRKKRQSCNQPKAEPGWLD